MKSNLILLFFLSLLFSSCGNNDGFGTPPTVVSQQILLDEINEVRTAGCQCGTTYFPPVNEVVWNTELENIAETHSVDMDFMDNMTHTGSDGSSFVDRLYTANYTGWNTAAENIAKGYITEEAVVEGWIESEGHCKNIMNGDFSKMGVSIEGLYWTQLFSD